MGKKLNWLFILLLTSSCKVLQYDKDIISYTYIPEYNRTAQIQGDFQKIHFFRNDNIFVSPAYFRENRESLEGYRILLVTLLIPPEYSFKNYGSVNSTEFGSLAISNKSKYRMVAGNKYDQLDFYTSLEDIDITERYKRIHNDTIKISVGKLVFKFAPKKTN